LAPLDAVFEAISGVTTTGLSTVTDIGAKPHTFRFARAWMQWYGGLGVMVLSLALIVAPGTAARRLGDQERDGSDLAGSTRAYARRVLVAYILVTVAGLVVLLLMGVAPADAAAYILAAVSTGGFSPQAGSLAPLGAAAAILVTLLCVVCAVPLVFWSHLVRQRFGSLRYLLGVALEPRPLLLLCIGFTCALVACFRSEGMAWGDALYHSALMACSAQTTSGFSSLNPAEVGAASKLVMIASMMIGGNVGSTAGGFKIIRLLIFLRLVCLLVRRTCLTAHTVFNPRLGGRRLEFDEIQEALMVILLFSGVILASWFSFLWAGFDPLDSLFEVVSATNTVGLSTRNHRTRPEFTPESHPVCRHAARSVGNFHLVGVPVSRELAGQEKEHSMRIVFVGISDDVSYAAGSLVEKQHEVIIIEADAEKIEQYEDNLDCSFLHGDGSKPDILEEVGPEQTDVLFCSTRDDQTNILASLVGKSLGFSRVVTHSRDQALESICLKLGLEDTIIPSRSIGRSLVDLVLGAQVPELATVLRGESRFFLLMVGADEAGPVRELGLPKRAKAICFYRNSDFELTDADSELQEGDEVVVLTYSDALEALRERFAGPEEAGREEKKEEK